MPRAQRMPQSEPAVRSDETHTPEGRALDCTRCGARRWVWRGDYLRGDVRNQWVEACYRCVRCGRVEFVELHE
jgi:DNA-directed RNA polymerase subunit RPC12/RpoP